MSSYSTGDHDYLYSLDPSDNLTVAGTQTEDISMDVDPDPIWLPSSDGEHPSSDDPMDISDDDIGL